MAKLPPVNRYLTGATLYGYLQRPADDFYWHVGNAAFEAFVAGHWTSYAVAYTERPGSSGDYDADVPSGFTAAGRYRLTVAKQAGGSPAVTDKGVGGVDAWDWNGAAEGSLAAVPAAVLDQGIVGHTGAGTVGEILRYAGAQAGGKWVVDGVANVLHLYALDGALLATLPLSPTGGPYTQRGT